MCRLVLEADKRALADKAQALHERAARAEATAENAKRAAANARAESERATRLQGHRAAAAESRAATLLQALEGAEGALRDSQATAVRLLRVSAAGGGRLTTRAEGSRLAGRLGSLQGGNWLLVLLKDALPLVQCNSTIQL
jgi:hypothetical protein